MILKFYGYSKILSYFWFIVLKLEVLNWHFRGEHVGALKFHYVCLINLIFWFLKKIVLCYGFLRFGLNQPLIEVGSAKIGAISIHDFRCGFEISPQFCHYFSVLCHSDLFSGESLDIKIIEKVFDSLQIYD